MKHISRKFLGDAGIQFDCGTWNDFTKHAEINIRIGISEGYTICMVVIDASQFLFDHTHLVDHTCLLNCFGCLKWDVGNLHVVFLILVRLMQ